MPGCALKCCKARYGQFRIGWGLFSFPRFDHEVREAWIRFVQLERNQDDWLPSTSSKLCSKHFRKEDIMFTGRTGRIRLNRCSIPHFIKIEDEDELSHPRALKFMGYFDTDSNLSSHKRTTLKAQVAKLIHEKVLYQEKIKELKTVITYMNYQTMMLLNHIDNLRSMT